jgi:acid phosphatase
MSMRIRRALIAHRCLFNPVVWLAVVAVLTLVSAPWSRGAGITARVGLVAAALPTPAHVVVVVEENRSAAGIIGNKSAPYVNSLATNGALMCSPSRSPTQRTELLGLFAGDTFAGLRWCPVEGGAEPRPERSRVDRRSPVFRGSASVGSTTRGSGKYARKHARG